MPKFHSFLAPKRAIIIFIVIKQYIYVVRNTLVVFSVIFRFFPIFQAKLKEQVEYICVVFVLHNHAEIRHAASGVSSRMLRTTKPCMFWPWQCAWGTRQRCRFRRLPHTPASAASAVAGRAATNRPACMYRQGAREHTFTQ